MQSEEPKECHMADQLDDVKFVRKRFTLAGFLLLW